MSDEHEQRYLSHLMHQFVSKAPGGDVTAKWTSGDGFTPGTTLTNLKGYKVQINVGQPAFASKEFFSVVDNKLDIMSIVSERFNVPAYHSFSKKQDVDEVFSAAKEVLACDDNPIGYPCIVKPNRGSRSYNVHIVRNEEALLQALSVNLKDSDHGERIILQQCIENSVDVRGILFRGKCVYAKLTERFEQITTKVAFHELDDRDVTDPVLLGQLDDVADYLFSDFGLEYTGIDFRRDKDGTLWFLECNSGPMGIDRIPEEPLNELLALLYDRVVDGEDAAVELKDRHDRFVHAVLDLA